MKWEDATAQYVEAVDKADALWNKMEDAEAAKRFYTAAIYARQLLRYDRLLDTLRAEINRHGRGSGKPAHGRPTVRSARQHG